jgi:ATP-binding cassette, subfamily B, bacterial PglK
MLIDTASKIRFLLTRKSKFFLVLFLLFSLAISALETIGISAIMPFISAASHPEYILSNEYLSYIYKQYGFSSTPDFVVVFGALLIVFYLFRQIYIYVYGYMLSRFAFGRYHYFAYRLFSAYMSLPYQEFVQKTPATLSKTIVDEAMSLSSMLLSMLVIFSEIMVVLFLYALLLMTNLKMTIVLTAIVVAQLVLMSSTVSKLIKKESFKKSELQDRFLKVLNESFGNFKLIKLLSSEKKIVEEFEKASAQYAKASIQNSTLAPLPRSLLETVGLIMLVGSCVYVLLKYQYAYHVIPIISMYALALYRILPAITKIGAAYSDIATKYHSLEIIHADLSYEMTIEGDDIVSFEREIGLKKISFSFNSRWNVLHNLDLTIRKGQKIAIMGDSGSGKSTLADIIMGIYKPQSGFVYVDKSVINEKNIKSWRKNIGFIPRHTYLFDGTLAKNVAFGYEIDEQKVIVALKKADIYDFFADKGEANAWIGEGGVKLSGGQKQRLGIARAMYNDPTLLVFDDSTSALDNETQTKIFEQICSASSEKTLIVVTQRESTAAMCDKAYRVEKGKVIKITKEDRASLS